MEHEQQRGMTLIHWVLGAIAIVLIAVIAFGLAIRRRDDHILTDKRSTARDSES
jgi:hypothetical protein